MVSWNRGTPKSSISISRYPHCRKPPYELEQKKFHDSAKTVLMSNCGSRCTLTEASFETSTGTLASVICLVSYVVPFGLQIAQSSHISGFRNDFTNAGSVFLCIYECKIVQSFVHFALPHVVWHVGLWRVGAPSLGLTLPYHHWVTVCILVEYGGIMMATHPFALICSA